MVASARITLVQETARQFGFLLFIPIYRNGAAINTLEDRRANLIGFGLGVFRIGDLVQKSFAGTGEARSDVDIVVVDQSAPPGRQFLFSTNSDLTRADGEALDVFTAAEIDVAGRRWKVLATPAPGVHHETAWLPWTIGTAGILFSVLLGAYIQQMLGRQTRIERLVTARTATLEFIHAITVAANEAKNVDEVIATCIAAVCGHTG